MPPWGGGVVQRGRRCLLGAEGRHSHGDEQSCLANVVAQCRGASPLTEKSLGWSQCYVHLYCSTASSYGKNRFNLSIGLSKKCQDNADIPIVIAKPAIALPQGH